MKNRSKLMKANYFFFHGKTYRELLNLEVVDETIFSEDYLNTILFEKEDDCFRFHLEFDLVLYYYLIDRVKHGIIAFQHSIERNFSTYKNENRKFEIPLAEYETFYKDLPEDSPIKNAIMTLAETRSFVIGSDGRFVVEVNPNKISTLLSNLNSYRF